MEKDRNIRDKEEKLSIAETNGDIKVKKLKTQIEQLKLKVEQLEEKEMKLAIEVSSLKGEKETA